MKNCEVWWGSSAQELDWHASLLAAADRERIDALRHDEDKARFLVANALLRLAVAEYLACPPGDVIIDRTCTDCGKPHGKPVVARHPVHVSVSHSGQRVAVAVTSAAEVGIDVEAIDRRVDISTLSRSVVAEDECEDEDFFLRWARKEAVLKATGDGLRVPMTGLSLAPDGSVRRYAGRPDLPERCMVRDLNPGPGYAAAVAVLTGEPVSIVERDAASLLKRSNNA